jgi:hypothetical protein
MGVDVAGTGTTASGETQPATAKPTERNITTSSTLSAQNLKNRVVLLMSSLSIHWHLWQLSLDRSVADPALCVGCVVTLGQRVARVTAWVQLCKVLKVAAPALYISVITPVHVPDLNMLVPFGHYVVPGRCRVMALDTVLASPPGMPRLVTVGTDIVQSLKVREAVTLEAVQLTVRTLKLHGMTRRVDL